MQISNLSINIVESLLIETNYSKRLSKFFIHQLQCRIELSKDIQSIIDEINYLEKLIVKTPTKKASKFRHGKLKGFWHSHFFSGHLEDQAANYLKLFDEDGKFEQLFKDSYEKATTSKELANLITNEIVGKQFRDNNHNGSWTGHWIIFAKYNGANYYLMLANHSKRGEDTDPIYDKMKFECEAQFPFLFTNKN
jgi:mRNA-degrading endonuclease YafQ of YafQ-DinJ toxin-antitoxin module|nr:hypothetical protein [Moraxella sp. CTOTU47724]